LPCNFLLGKLRGAELRADSRSIHVKLFIGFDIFLGFIVGVDCVRAIFKNTGTAASGNPFGHAHPFRNCFSFLRVCGNRLTILLEEDRRDFKFTSCSKNALIGDQVTVFWINGRVDGTVTRICVPRRGTGD
jgi:hypothetical protein